MSLLPSKLSDFIVEALYAARDADDAFLRGLTKVVPVGTSGLLVTIDGKQIEIDVRAAQPGFIWDGGYERGSTARGAKLGCGCCAGPVEDRCCCEIHCDIPQGLVPGSCSMHRAPGVES